MAKLGGSHEQVIKAQMADLVVLDGTYDLVGLSPNVTTSVMKHLIRMAGPNGRYVG